MQTSRSQSVTTDETTPLLATNVSNGSQQEYAIAGPSNYYEEIRREARRKQAERAKYNQRRREFARILSTHSMPHTYRRESFVITPPLKTEREVVDRHVRQTRSWYEAVQVVYEAMVDGKDVKLKIFMVLSWLFIIGLAVKLVVENVYGWDG